MKEEKSSNNKVAIKKKKLNNCQKLFCQYFLQYKNAQKAYALAYDLDPKKQNGGYILLKRDIIQEEIERLKQEMYEELRVDRRDVITRLIQIAFADAETMKKNRIRMADVIRALELLYDYCIDLDDTTINRDNFIDALNVKVIEDWSDSDGIN